MILRNNLCKRELIFFFFAYVTSIGLNQGRRGRKVLLDKGGITFLICRCHGVINVIGGTTIRLKPIAFPSFVTAICSISLIGREPNH